MYVPCTKADGFSHARGGPGSEPSSAAALATVVFAGACRGPTAPGVAHAGVARVTALETDVLSQLNAIRVEHGLVPLKLSATLGKAAAAHSVQMGELGYFAHESADGSAFWKRIQRFYASTRYSGRSARTCSGRRPTSTAPARSSSGWRARSTGRTS